MTSNPINNSISNAINSSNVNADKVKGAAGNTERHIDTPAEQQLGQQQAAPTDRVSLTSSVQKMREIEQNLAKLPDIDSERVEKIKQAIANNEFSVNAENIADKLIQLEKML